MPRVRRGGGRAGGGRGRGRRSAKSKQKAEESTDAASPSTLDFLSDFGTAAATEKSPGEPVPNDKPKSTATSTSDENDNTPTDNEGVSVPLSLPAALNLILGADGAQLQLDESFIEYLSGSCEELLSRSYAPSIAEDDDVDDATWIKRKNLERETSLNELLFSMIPACGFSGTEAECLAYSRKLISLTQTKEQAESASRRKRTNQKPRTIADMKKFQVHQLYGSLKVFVSE